MVTASRATLVGGDALFKKDMNNCVVYFHRNPITSDIFYVGIGLPKRPYSRSDRSDFWKKYVKKYGNPIIEINHQGLSWTEAVLWEKFFIAMFGRRKNGTGILVNLTDGGEGSLGRVHTEEARRKISSARKGVPRDWATREKIKKIMSSSLNPNIGAKRSEETRRKQSEARKRRITKDETRIRMSLSRKGKKYKKKGNILNI